MNDVLRVQVSQAIGYLLSYLDDQRKALLMPKREQNEDSRRNEYERIPSYSTVLLCRGSTRY